jgi:thiol:disulfide interchange protein DsbD
MLATALWLFSLLPIHYGERSWWFAIFLLLLALSAWIFGEFVQRGRARRSVALAASVLVLLAAYVGVLEHKLQWRVADAGRKQGDAPSHAPKGLSWQPWSREAVDAGRSEGHPVLIDFTANWCLTCNTIVKPALENSRVRERLLKLNAVPLLGDYSRPMPLITEELDRLAHPGVPLVVIYPTDPKKPPLVLPDPSPFSLPSQYASVILDYLDRAVQ